MGKKLCPLCKALMPYIPDKGGYCCLQCGNTNPYIGYRKRKKYVDEHYYEEY